MIDAVRRSSTILLSAVLAAAGLQATVADPATAAATCTYRPVMPKRISVGQSVTELRAPLAVSGPADCQDISVTAQLVHGSDSYFLWWTSTKAEVESVYASSVSPGTYRTTAEDCDSYDADYNELSCTVTRTATVIKFAGRPTLSAKRSKTTLTLTARTARYAEYEGSKAMTAKISIQRLTGKKWKTIRRTTAKGGHYTYRLRARAAARYRVVSAETATAFAATSRSVRK
ncbi:hypothetical protein SAMN05443575_2987 [Jatrophihabitans endophyticus]|uniref:Ig-like domain-containing protein n=1 Tax=Jatrophihabitans endophyticus TaxID=1206085 RepID=A0A1M5P627_9ACTN|nr:hypothetical protein [Jatrophihabitans endophyticus]SHG97218.1 hypothetical protein SAMN05443575_2987 [Jatrophihabitans endophyticus]